MFSGASSSGTQQELIRSAGRESSGDLRHGGMGMAWIAIVPPSARHPNERYQVRYQDGPHQRLAGIFPTLRRAEAERRALERADREPLPHPTEPDPAKARTLCGEYVTTRWWPAWKDQHPASEYGTRKKVEKRILPTFGDIPLGELDPSTIGRWKAAMVAEGLTPRTVNTYLSLLGTILNAAVDDDYLTRSPLVRKSGAGRTAATRNQPVPRREVWLLREQLDRLVAAIDSRYRALVLRRRPHRDALGRADRAALGRPAVRP